MTRTYDERRERLTACVCGRLVSNPGACRDACACLLDRRDDNLARIAAGQQARREARDGVS